MAVPGATIVSRGTIPVFPIPSPNEPKPPSELAAASSPNANPEANPLRLNPNSPCRNPKSLR